MRLELKSVDTSQRLVSGYAAAVGNKDRTGDVIDKGAFDRTILENTDVVAFIGHDSSKLQVGEAIEIRADAAGLFTTTSIYNTADGDALLEVAKRRLARGKTLGMSIGYRTVKQRMEGGTRHLLDVDLVEYSFLASPDFAANPLATVTGVKATSVGHVITTEDSYEDLIDDLEDAAAAALSVYSVCVCATFPDHVIVSTWSYAGAGDGEMQFYDFPYQLGTDGEPTLGTPTPVDPAFVPADAKARATAVQEAKHMDPKQRPAWDAAFISALPDDAFATIDGDGTATKDDSDRTVPRSLRHYPHHAADGTVDAEHLAHAIKHASTSSDGERALTHLAAHAFAAIHPMGIDVHAPEWSEGAPAVLLSMGFKLDRIISDIAEDRRSMERLGIDTKKGARLNSAMRGRLKDLHSSLGQILDWADAIEKGDDGKMRVDMFRHRLAMLAVDQVS